MSANTLVMRPGRRKVPSLPLQERQQPTTPQKSEPREERRKEEEKPKKPPRPKPIPAGRDRLAQFAARRNKVNETKDSLYAIIVKRLAQLSMEYLAKPTNQGVLSFLWGGSENSVHIPVVGVDLALPTKEDATVCFGCRTPFGYFQKRVVCQLCMMSCCTKCAYPRVPLQVIKEAPKTVPGPNGAAQQTAPLINACERCSNIVKKWKFHQKFQRVKLSASTNPLVVKYEYLLKRDEIVVEALLKYENCVQEVDPPKPVKRAANEPDNILAMRLGEASHLAAQVGKHLQTMAAALQDIQSLVSKPTEDGKGPTVPPSDATRKLVHTIHSTASTRLDGHISYYQTLQKRLLRLQLNIVGDVYNKFHQLSIEVNQLHAFGADEEKQPQNGSSGADRPNVFLLLRETLTVIKAEIQEMMITLGKQQWPKFEKALDATLKDQMAKGSKLLTLPPGGKAGDDLSHLLMTKLLSVIQHEAQVLDNNTAVSTLKESKTVIKKITQTILSHYF